MTTWSNKAPDDVQSVTEQVEFPQISLHKEVEMYHSIYRMEMWLGKRKKYKNIDCMDCFFLICSL